ncbi:hypothetical protein COHA_006493 [Chlorella ohadii]|uniref:Uncharacterized protein n=1 Tax=Chlorella ohadii TaxID=2649997 RepID=A0AAD5DPQ6_9CHLO|nr:hypothetical protein COHA_006493 [Chlorella ohadii]
MAHRSTDPELDAWEMVSSSEDGGSEGGSDSGEAAAAEALAASFLATEPLSPLAADQAVAEGTEGDSPPLLPGSPENAQLLQLMAAEAPAAPSLAAASEEGEGEAVPVPASAAGMTDTTTSGGMGQASFVIPDASAPALPSPPTPTALAAPIAPLGGGAAASAAMRRAASLHLRVVRSDEQEALERAVAELEKRATQRDRELALAQQRLNSAQTKLAEESSEAHRLRKIAMIACSICAFLGLKALMGGRHRASSCGGQAAACAPSGATMPRAPCVAHSVHEPPVALLQRKVAIQDFVQNKKTPEGLRCRQLVPTSGGTSTSLWDATSTEELQQWLDESINVDVTHQVVEVQEEFALGLGEVHRARAAEKVKEGTKEVAHKTGEALSSAATAVGHQVNELDHKLRISERATAASTAVKESAVGRATGAALTKVGSAVSSTTKTVLANEKVQSATGAVGASFKKLGASLSSLGRRKADDAPGTEHVPQFVQESEGFEPPASSQPHEPPAPVAGGNLRNPTAAPAAVNASPEAQQQATFTLDDNDEPKAP